MMVETHPISARGPHGEDLALHSTRIGVPSPSQALLVLAGVHGVEGFAPAAILCELTAHLTPAHLPDDVAVVLIHAVNPWGMAWSRRQNEHNVDLNRNWRRSDVDPVHNDAYDRIHTIACPDGDDLPDADAMLTVAETLVAERGEAWLRDAITSGQYRHADGLHFGGDRTEPSNEIVEQIAARHLAGAERVLTIDLHTGHGPYGEMTLLSRHPVGSWQDDLLRTRIGAERIEVVGAPRQGQIAAGIADLAPGAEHAGTVAEFGTAGEIEQLVATHLEQWVHRHGDRNRPEHLAAIERYRACFTPDDPDWERVTLAAGLDLLESAVAAMSS